MIAVIVVHLLEFVLAAPGVLHTVRFRERFHAL
jgi:hypothetical protein